MRYSEIIIQEQEYTRSANIQFDITNDRKLGRFIPNETTISLIKDYFIDIIRQPSRVHSRILYGSYGTGKSHFLTVISDLLGKIHTNGVAYEKFLERVGRYDKDLVTDIKGFVKKRKPYLIVPIIFDFEDFNRCISFSLKKVLENNGIKVKMKGFYSYALDLINQWQDQNDSKEKLVAACNDYKTTIEELIKGLESFDDLSRKKFVKVFERITYGVKFVFEPANLIDNLDEVNCTINEKYSGIVFIFDEFGRYIEDNIRTIKVKELQDLAEYCDHSKYDNHLILVSHKEISQYTTNTTAAVADEWKKVEGRFKSTSINEKRDQCLSLVSNILVKNSELWPVFSRQFSNDFERIKRQSMAFKGFLIADEKDDPVNAGYPLHPIALYALDKLSKKVAQSERTFFTYLSSKEENSLYEFLEQYDTEKDGFHFVGIDRIFDYFQSNFISLRSDNCYKIYRQYKQALAKVNSFKGDSLVEDSILKAIAIINMIDDASVLSAKNEILLQIIDYCQNEIVAAIDVLVSKKIIKFTRVFNHYVYFESSIFDIDKMIEDNIADITREAVITTLNKDFVDFVLYPNEHNEHYKIKRVFIPIFTTYDEVIKKTFSRRLPSYYDGAFCMVVGDADSLSEELFRVSTVMPRTIYSIKDDGRELEREVKKYLSICLLESKQDEYAEKDPEIKKEIAFYKEEQKTIIFSQINEWKNLSGEHYHIICEGNEEKIKGFSALSARASIIMDQAYPQTLIVNNDMLNKNVTTGAMNNAKKLAIESIIRGESEKSYYGLTILSQEYTSFRSVLARNGFYSDDNIQLSNFVINNANSISNVITVFLNEIRTVPKKFATLIDRLKQEPYGLRNGYMSLLFAYFIKDEISKVVIQFHGDDQEITADLFEKMMDNPSEYTLWINNWSKQQIEYIEKIEKAYRCYINIQKRRTNRLKALYDGLSAHYKSVSKYARLTENVSDATIRYRKLVEKSSKDYNKFFFKDVKILSSDYELIAISMCNAKSELDTITGKLLNETIKKIKVVYGAKTTISNVFLTFYQSQCVGKTKVFDYYTNSFIELIRNISDESDEEIVRCLAKLITGFDIDFWNDGHQAEFIEKLTKIKQSIEEYVEKAATAEDEIKLTIIADGGEISSKFSKTELSSNAKTMKNKINNSIGNFGQAITYEEKLQVLLSILDEQMRK
jgi:hypothetical protein